MARVTTCTVYLDSTGAVLACAGEHAGKTTPSLAAVQARLPAVVERVVGAPLRLLVKSDVSEVYSQRTSGDGTDPSHYSTVTNLSAFKAKLKEQIGFEIGRRILLGFQHTGTSVLTGTTVTLTFSLKDHSQRNYLGCVSAPERIAPTNWPNVDDTDALVLGDAAAVQAFGEAALDTVRGHQADGASARMSIEGAADAAAAQAIFDSYIGS